MSRPQRIEYEGAYYHVMNRGQGKKDIFHDKVYYDAFLEILSESVIKFGLEVHAYCLMTNHYHLLVSTPRGNLQRAMRHIGSVYTQKYNRLSKIDGALFKGRYKAVLVDSDEYLLHLSKYIHKNPLEANMVKDLSGYPWSSYPAYIGKRKHEKWLTMDEVYGQITLGRTKAKRYRTFVEDVELNDEVASFYSKQRISPVLGSAAFIELVAKLGKVQNSEAPRVNRLREGPSLEQIVGQVAEAYNCEKQDILDMKRGRGLKNYPRKVAMYLSQLLGDYKLVEIANHFGMKHYGGVASAIHMVKAELANDKKAQRTINSIVKRFDPESF
jgi:putative transposase